MLDESMDAEISQIGLFLAATFAASFVAGVSGFAFALIAAAVWLHIMTPLETASLTIGYGMIVQGFGAWKLRHALSLSRLWPFLAGGAPGVAIGVVVLRWANPAHMRAGIGVFLVLYAAFNLLRPALSPVRGGTITDMGVGLLSGMLGAMTGFAGILIVIWCQMRGWPKDIQRGVFQPASVALLAMCALALGVTGSVAPSTMYLFLIGLPVLAAGTWAGFRLYGRLDEDGFRRIVLILLLVSGVPLIAGLL
jgi:uncharacterized membrane protein YfcA